MKIYRLYYIEYEYVSSNVYDEDGYCDNKQTINKWIEEHEDEEGELWDKNGRNICSDSELQIEEIEVIQ